MNRVVLTLSFTLGVGASSKPQNYNAGYSMFVAAWTLLQTFPGQQFQTGLPGTWMFAQFDGAEPKDMYSDVEGV